MKESQALEPSLAEPEGSQQKSPIWSKFVVIREGQGCRELTLAPFEPSSRVQVATRLTSEE